ncbi:MAG: hypothetical protein L6R36_006998 [Xanthoria steineri]|nr:MAG: hypothetical protein L6R36_006998 [Xanthoria steineri]
MAYRACLQSQCATLPTDDIISLCTTAIEASFSKDNKSHPPSSETLDTVHWYIYDSQQTRLPAKKGCQLWSKVRQAYGKQTVDDYLAFGRAFADKTHRLNAKIQAAWPEGAYGAIDSQYHPGGIDRESLRQIAKVNKRMPLDIAKRDMSIIIQERVRREEEMLHPSDLELIIAEHGGTAEASNDTVGGGNS